MRIRELLEHVNSTFDETKYIERTQDGNFEPNFDLAEDLSFYMHDNDEMYRRHVYPAVVKCLQAESGKRKLSSNIFEKAVDECYKSYTKKFPIRYLPNELDKELKEQVCSKLLDDFKKHHSEGKYKD